MQYMDCPLNYVLFPWFPTEVSIVYGQNRARVLRVFDALRLKELVKIYNGYANIYIRLYQSNIINKVVFDIDAPDLEAAIQDMLSLVSVLEEERLPYVVVFSGRKGFHVYLLTRHVQIAEDATFRSVLKSVIDYYADAAQARYVDSETGYKKAGWIRLPNTLHPVSRRYAIYMPVLEVSVSDVLTLASQPRCPDLNGMVSREPPDPREYVGMVRLPEYSDYRPKEVLPEMERVPQDLVRYLRPLLRPCVLYHSLHDNPSHFIRTQLVTELCWLWFSEDEIVHIIERLGWDDYSERVTRYHVFKICEKVRDIGLVPASCRTLQERGYCLAERCPFYPGYHFWWGRI